MCLQSEMQQNASISTMHKKYHFYTKMYAYMQDFEMQVIPQTWSSFLSLALPWDQFAFLPMLFCPSFFIITSRMKNPGNSRKQQLIRLHPIDIREWSHLTWEWKLLVPIHIKDKSQKLLCVMSFFCPMWKGFEKNVVLVSVTSSTLNTV